MRPPLVIAIDGPAGSGKSTTAREVARRLGLRWVDTGAMYRAVTLWLLRRGIHAQPGPDLEAALREMRLQLIPGGAGLRVILNGEDVTQRIREQDVTALVSQVAELAQVRQALAGWQREMAREGNVVMEGRDIGTVVCPEAPVKVFLWADLSTRAARRAKELAQMGQQADPRLVAEQLSCRDSLDSNRTLAPLTPAPDAVLIDTTSLTIDQQVEAVIKVVREKGYEVPTN